MQFLYWGLAWIGTSFLVAIPTGKLLAGVSASYPEAAPLQANHH